MNEGKNWFSAPPLPLMVLVQVIWLVGTTCSLLAMTNFFSETPFQHKNIIMWYLIIASLVVALLIARNFVKTSIRNRPSKPVK